jgi:DNA-binding CsgD family transcriptional regulator/tetratricopeptide (TPR) repeat protein
MLVERDSLLAELVAALDEALEGTGRVVFVGGEAGVGKTTLVRELAASARSRCAVRIGGADNVTTADALAAFQDAVPEIGEKLATGGDRIRLFRALRDAVAADPGLLVLEDVHWADEATLDALRYLARRIEGLPALILATYRHDEVPAWHPLTAVMGELATAPGVRRLLVPPLSVSGVAELVDRAGAPLDPAELHGRTGGNAFFVTESLAVSAGTLPVTVSDAILARVARLSTAAQDAAAAAAVLGTAADAELLAVVAGCELAAVDECANAGVLVRTGSGFSFRHELAREAVERSLSAVRRNQLHGRALHALTRSRPEDHRALAHHAAGCGDDVAACTHAVLAAERAARGSAHREAAEHYRLALRHTTTRGARADLFVALSYECYLTDQLPEALAARQRALELHELEGDARERGDDERWLSRLSWFLGRGADAERYALRAVATLEPLGAGAELAMAYSNLAQLRMLAQATDEVERWGGKALALARAVGNASIESHALNNLGAAAISAGRFDDGVAALTRSLDIARAEDLPEHVARAYTNLGSAATIQRRYGQALVALEAGIAYCEERDLDSWSRYMTASRCVVLAEQGRLDDALESATKVLEHPDTAAISAIPAAATAARVLARRGMDGSAELALAVRLASATGELQRMAPALCAAAEQAWLEGRTPVIEALTDDVWQLALTRQEPWAVGELAWWRMLGGCPTPAEVAMAEPFALMISRDPRAAGVWEKLGSPIWAAYSAAVDPDPASADRAARCLDRLGATPAIEALRRTRREHGLPLPRRPRARARNNPAQLTDRELEVLHVLADGLSTTEIAERLILSPRTVEHHVAAVLRKLGQPTRARAVAAARRAGLLDR